jgi:hypothetical protein
MMNIHLKINLLLKLRKPPSMWLTQMILFQTKKILRQILQEKFRKFLRTQRLKLKRKPLKLKKMSKQTKQFPLVKPNSLQKLTKMPNQVTQRMKSCTKMLMVKFMSKKMPTRRLAPILLL